MFVAGYDECRTLRNRAFQNTVIVGIVEDDGQRFGRMHEHAIGIELGKRVGDDVFRPSEFTEKNLLEFLQQRRGDRQPEGSGTGVVQKDQWPAAEMQAGYVDIGVGRDRDHAVGVPWRFSWRYSAMRRGMSAWVSPSASA